MNKPALILSRETLASPVGDVIALTDPEGRLRAVDFHDYEERMTRLLHRHYGAGGWDVTETKQPSEASRAITAYFEGDLHAIETLETATGGTAFQRGVWSALREIPANAPISYGELAERIGRPKAVRAVGLANGANPIAIVAPCHRVVGASGALTGYGGGLHRKRWLLDHEAACGSSVA